ncbi:MAG: binding-protein-dependent transport system inner rane component [Rhodoglobus sp.]|nr:binding-protein-dependent transport system inner rane component [Rhodoglobus sp.]
MTKTSRSYRSDSPLARSDRRFGAILAAPALLLVIGLIAWPAIQTLIYSLQDVTFVSAGGWNNFENYTKLFSNGKFLNSLGLTAVYAVGFLVLSTVLGLAFALLLDQRFRGRWLARGLLIVPWAFPWVMVGIVWKWFVDGDVGVLRALVVDTGLADDFSAPLSTKTGAVIVTILAAAWRQASLAALLFLAGLQTMPREIHEASLVDGASVWQRFTHMTLPWLRPVIGVVIILNTISGFMQFDVIWAMTQGGPGNATTVMSIFLYQQLFVDTNLALASATSVVLGALALGLGFLFVKLMYRDTGVTERVG